MPEQEARLDAAIRSFQEQAARAADLKDRIAGLRGSARNSDGSVTVTVAPSGAVLGLRLSPLAMKRSHTQLQQEITATIRQATQQAAAALEQTVQPMLGDRTEQFKEAFSAHAGAVRPLGPSTPPPATSLPVPPPAAGSPDFRDEEPAPPRPLAASRNRIQADDVEGDDFGGSILR